VTGRPAGDRGRESAALAPGCRRGPGRVSSPGVRATDGEAPRAPPGDPRRGPLLGLAAAALFGGSTPVAKLLVPDAGVLVLAGLLYAGAGLGLTAAQPFRRRGAEAPLQRSDLLRLAGVVLAGGVVGPVLLVAGLTRLSASAASLLLNLEAPFTIGLAVLALRERLARREAAGAAIIVAAAGVLTWAPGAVRLDAAGVLCVAGACAAWAVDNTLSQGLALRDPVAVARVKALAAGAFNVALGAALGERFPPAGPLAAALATGVLGYGASLVLHLLAVRAVGAARQAALFATAPFLGAVLAVPLLGERPGPVQLGAAALMALGITAVVRARHGHAHRHPAEEHTHAHVHDAHHAHAHADPTPEPHAHPHRHEPLVHDHPHLPDVHHRHDH
jgi:drug/metabolite transporter (DMT)-like permease